MSTVTGEKLEDAKSVILDTVILYPGTSFVEIERMLNSQGLVETDQDNFFRVFHPQFNSVIMWQTENFLLTRGVAELVKEGKIVGERCQELIYAMDGNVLPLPIATSLKEYKEPHWWPVTLSVNPDKVSIPTPEEQRELIKKYRVLD